MDTLVLVTRPENQAVRFAEDVRGVGGVPVVAPLLSIVSHGVDFSLYPCPELIVVTSANAVAGQNFPAVWRGVRVLAVGDHTAMAARQAGFCDVSSVHGSSKDVVNFLADRPPYKICYLRGEGITMDLAGSLPQHQFFEIISYGSVAAARLPHEVIALFPRLHTVTVFSARTAQILALLIERHRLGAFTPTINLLSLSAHMLEYLSPFSWRQCAVAPHPDQAHMTQMLRQLLEDTA